MCKRVVCLVLIVFVPVVFLFVLLDFGRETAVAAPTDSPIIINEINADPDSVNGDANGDGVIGSDDDEFVELVNTGSAVLDLSGWKLYDSLSTSTLRHAFAASAL